MNHRHTDFQSVAQKSQPPTEKGLTETGQGTGAPYGALSVQNDPDLDHLIKVWPDLQDDVKQTITNLISEHGGDHE